MPIRKSNRLRYPPDWDSRIRPMILERAGHCCEGSPRYPECRAANHQPHPVTGSKVVLTIGHLNHTPEDCSRSNLRAWCQRCHVTYDAPYKTAMNAARTLCDNPDALIMLLARIGEMARLDTADSLHQHDLWVKLEAISRLVGRERLAVASTANHSERDDGIDPHAVQLHHDPAQIDLLELIQRA